MLRIDTHNGWFKGLGDLVCFAWIGESLRAAGSEAEFYAFGWRAEMLRLFQQRVTGDPHGAVVPQEGYETAVRKELKFNYVEWIAQQCCSGALRASDESGGHRPPLQLTRPRLDLPPMERELGRKASAHVLVFPDCAWPARTWPRNYFLELCRLLKASGIDVAVVTEKRMEQFGAFHCIYGQSLAFVAAAMQAAQLVIANDSGPAHLAGTIGTKVLAIQGPTTERIYAHMPEVTSFRKKMLDCAGCHCLPPFRESCALGCHELYRTFPEDVFKQAMQILEGSASSLPGTDPSASLRAGAAVSSKKKARKS